MSARVIVLRPRRRREPTPLSKRPLVGRVRLATLRRCVKAWARVPIPFGPDQRPTLQGDAHAALGSALIALERMTRVWDTEEGRLMAAACYSLAATQRLFAGTRQLERPAEVYDLATERARRAAGGT